jgi:hypothetical protein
VTGGEQPLVGDERGPALEVPVAVERRLPGPRASRCAAAAHHPAPAHAFYLPTQHIDAYNVKGLKGHFGKNDFVKFVLSVLSSF